MTNDDQGVTDDVATPPVTATNFSVGATLREGRLRLGNDIPQVAEKLRIRQVYIEALEDGRHKDLPGGTYAIGFLRSYADFLGLDGEEMVRRFKQEAAGDLSAHSELQFPSPVSEGRMPTAPVLLVGLLVAIVAYGLWWSLGTKHQSLAELVPAVPERLAGLLHRPAGVSPEESSEASPKDAAGNEAQESAANPATPPAATETTTPAAASTAASAPEPSATPAPASAPAPAPAPVTSAVTPPPAVETPPSAATVAPPPATPANATAAPAKTSAAAPSPSTVKADATPTPEAAPEKTASPVVAAPVVAPPVVDGASDARVVLKALSDDCWIQVRESDGQLVISRLLRRGDVYRVPDRSGLTLTAGNAGALEVTVDGQVVRSLGTSKQVRRDISLDPAKLRK